ncbi:MAG: fibronectin type III domain-containing protein [Acutalibacteraceae bacterium]
MNKGKRLLSLFLSFVLMLSLSGSAFGTNGFITTKPAPALTEKEKTSASQKPDIGKVEQLEAYQTTETSISIHWKAVKDAENYGVYIYNEKSGDYELTAAETKNSAQIKSLKPGKVYRFKVQGFSEYNGETVLGQMSDELIAVTACKKVSGIVTTNIEKSSIRLSWSKVSGATSYEVWIYDRENRRFSLNIITQTNTAEIKNLSKNTIYSFKVRAVKEAQSAVSYGKFSGIYSEFTDTSGLPCTKAQAAKLYNKTVNNAKKEKNVKVAYTKQIDTKTVSCSKNSLLRTVKNIMNLFSGKISPTYNFSSGKSAGVSLNSILEPYGKNASIRGNDIKSFSAKKENGKTVLKITLKADKSSYDGTTTSQPPKNGRAVKVPSLETLKTSPIKVKSATQSFKGAVLSAKISKNGKLENLSISCQAEIAASCRVATVNFKTVVGYTLKEQYKMTY